MAGVSLSSTTWQTVTLMAPQDHGYRAFIRRIARAYAEGGSTAALSGGIGPKTHAAAILVLVLLGVAMAGLLLRALFDR